MAVQGRLDLTVRSKRSWSLENVRESMGSPDSSEYQIEQEQKRRYLVDLLNQRIEITTAGQVTLFPTGQIVPFWDLSVESLCFLSPVVEEAQHGSRTLPPPLAVQERIAAEVNANSKKVLELLHVVYNPAVGWITVT